MAVHRLVRCAMLRSMGEFAAEPRRPARAPGLSDREVMALIMLCLGGFLMLAGWIYGVILLWRSSRWRPAEKLVATLVWPGGLALPAAGVISAALASPYPVCGDWLGPGVRPCPPPGTDSWVPAAAIGCAVSQAAVAGWLLWRARGRPAPRLPGPEAAGRPAGASDSP